MRKIAVGMFVGFLAIISISVKSFAESNSSTVDKFQSMVDQAHAQVYSQALENQKLLEKSQQPHANAALTPSTPGVSKTPENPAPTSPAENTPTENFAPQTNNVAPIAPFNSNQNKTNTTPVSPAVDNTPAMIQGPPNIFAPPKAPASNANNSTH